jgi:hypothetical protein
MSSGMETMKRAMGDTPPDRRLIYDLNETIKPQSEGKPCPSRQRYSARQDAKIGGQ